MRMGTIEIRRTRMIYPKSAIRACLDFVFLEEWILFGF